MSLWTTDIFLIQLASFFVLLFILGRVLFGPFQALLVEREARTTGDSRLADGYRSEAEAIGRRLEQEMAGARAQAMVEAEAIRARGRTEERRVLSEASAEAARRIAEIRAEVAAERSRALADLEKDSEAMAAEMVAAVLGQGGGAQ